MIAESIDTLIYTGREKREFKGQDGNEVSFLSYNFLVDDESGRAISFNSTNASLADEIQRMTLCHVLIDIQYSSKGLRSKLIEIRQLDDELEQ